MLEVSLVRAGAVRRRGEQGACASEGRVQGVFTDEGVQDSVLLWMVRHCWSSGAGPLPRENAVRIL